MNAFKYFTKIEACEGQWRATVRVQRWGPGAKTTEVEARVALVCASTDDGRPLTDGTNLDWTVVDWVASSIDTSSLHSYPGLGTRLGHFK